jgi:hypothetical protein
MSRTCLVSSLSFVAQRSSAFIGFARGCECSVGIWTWSLRSTGNLRACGPAPVSSSACAQVVRYVTIVCRVRATLVMDGRYSAPFQRSYTPRQMACGQARSDSHKRRAWVSGSCLCVQPYSYSAMRSSVRSWTCSAPSPLPITMGVSSSASVAVSIALVPGTQSIEDGLTQRANGATARVNTHFLVIHLVLGSIPTNNTTSLSGAFPCFSWHPIPSDCCRRPPIASAHGHLAFTSSPAVGRTLNPSPRTGYAQTLAAVVLSLNEARDRLIEARVPRLQSGYKPRCQPSSIFFPRTHSTTPTESATAPHYCLDQHFFFTHLRSLYQHHH